MAFSQYASQFLVAQFQTTPNLLDFGDLSLFYLFQRSLNGFDLEDTIGNRFTFDSAQLHRNQSSRATPDGVDKRTWPAAFSRSPYGLINRIGWTRHRLGQWLEIVARECPTAP